MIGNSHEREREMELCHNSFYTNVYADHVQFLSACMPIAQTSRAQKLGSNYYLLQRPKTLNVMEPEKGE